MKTGAKVKPLTGLWKGFEGTIIEIPKEENFQIVVEFEENETGLYYEDQLEVINQ